MLLDFEPQDALKHRLLANLEADDREELVRSMEKVFILSRSHLPAEPPDRLCLFSAVGGLFAGRNDQGR